TSDRRCPRDRSRTRRERPGRATVARMSVLRTMPVEHVLERGRDAKLRRSLSGRDLIGFGVGIIIGTGIFTLAGVEAREHAGPAAVGYAELASSVPTAGSAYTYAFATLGELFAWIIGWDLLLEFGLGLAVVSRSWSSYLANLFGLPQVLFGESAPFNIGAVLIIGILTVVAVLGIRQSSRLTNVLVAVKLAVCVLIIGVGVFFIDTANLTPFIPPAEPVE